MSQIQDRISQFRKMANDDPENELGHYRLGQLLMEDGQYDDAVASFRRTLELSPQFSKVYQLLGSCFIKMGKPEEAALTLTEGFDVADQRGDNIPRDEISKLLVQLGQPAPVPTRGLVSPVGATVGGFRCQRPGCVAGGYGKQLARPPMNDELGKRIYESVCADCWEYWLRNLSIKVINEMRLDLGDEKHVETYDQVMRETLGLS
jgi:Fe-S cluster biosynthesis and repair protein YggX